MPTFFRYERVPVWEEMSDGNNSNAGTPQHAPAAVASAAGVRAVEEPQPASPASTTTTTTAAAAAVAAAATGRSAHGTTAEAELEPPKVDMSAPPPYSECDDNTVVQHRVDAAGADHIISVDLAEEEGEAMLQPPSYEEVQRIKAVEAQLESGDHILLPPHTGNIDFGAGGVSGRSDSELEDARPTEEDLLGTDLLFFLSFAAAFFFNWVGFVVLVCFCHSVAGRSGALAGFGLSLAKWAVIMRHTKALAAQANTWLLWLLMLLGLVICMRAVLQYLNAKREWQHASAATRHRFLLFH